MSGHPLRPSDLPERGGSLPADATGQAAAGERVVPLNLPANRRGSRVLVTPIHLWLLVQLAALAMAVYRVPLAAQYPQPAEFQAVRLMLATQFSALALLFPWMLRTWGSGLAVSAAAWAMLFAATALSAGTFAATVPVGTFLTAWIVIFLTLAQVRGAGLQAIIMSVAATYVLGGPLMWYLQREFTTAATGSSAWVFGPLLAAISTTPHLPPSAWVQAAAAELATILLWKLASRPQNAPSRPSNFEAPRIIP